MTELSMTLATMHRPSMLVQAARFAAAALARRTQMAARPKGQALERLLSEEEELNQARVTGEATYSPTRHITVLASLLVAVAPPVT